MIQMRSILDVVEAQSRRIEDINSQLESARVALAERKTIDRAKGILMHSRRLNEKDAYTLLRLGSRQSLDVGLTPTPRASSMYYVLAAVGLFTLLVGGSVRLRRSCRAPRSTSCDSTRGPRCESDRAGY